MRLLFALTADYNSLVDESMVPFQTSYPLVLFMIWCIWAGNTAYPILCETLSVLSPDAAH